MDKNAVVRELAKLGQEEAILMRKLARVQGRRCNLLSSCIPDDVNATTIRAASAPKDDGGK